MMKSRFSAILAAIAGVFQPDSRFFLIDGEKETELKRPGVFDRAKKFNPEKKAYPDKARQKMLMHRAQARIAARGFA